MAGGIALRFFLVFVVNLYTSSMAADTLSESLERRIKALENQGLEQKHLLSQQQSDLNTLKKENNDYKLRFMQQEKLLNTYMRRVSILKTRVANIKQHRTNGAAVDKDSVMETHLGGNETTFDEGKERQPVVDVNNTKRTAVKKEMIRTPNDHVAFHATIQQDHLWGGLPIIVFPDVMLDLGNAYHNGTFTVPTTGIYILSVSVRINSESMLQASIRKNGAAICSAVAYTSSNNQDQGSVTVVSKLYAGDQVWVSSDYPIVPNLLGSGSSSFTGALLFPL